MKLTENFHPMLTPAIVRILNEFHIRTLSSLLTKPPEQVASITKMSYNSVLQLRKDLFRDHAAFASCGYELYQTWLSSPTLSCGSDRLEQLLGGGFIPGSVYEVFGEEGIGKTQLAMTAAAVTVTTSPNAVVYLDTKNDLCPQRLQEIVSSRDNVSSSQIQSAMDRVLIGKVYQPQHLAVALREVDRMISHSCTGPWSLVKLLILDNIAAPLTTYMGDPKGGFSTACSLIQILHQLATLRNLVVLVANNARVDKDNVRPALGNMWAGLADVRIIMERLEGEKRRVEVVMGAGMSIDRSCVINISKQGIF